MPVRIYDIAKRLGIESKEVLARPRHWAFRPPRSRRVRSIKSPPNISKSKWAVTNLWPSPNRCQRLPCQNPFSFSAPPDTPTLAAPALPADTNLKADAAEPIAEAPTALRRNQQWSRRERSHQRRQVRPNRLLATKSGSFNCPETGARIVAKTGPSKLPPRPAPALPPARPAGRQATPAFSQRPAGKAPDPLTSPAGPKFVPNHRRTHHPQAAHHCPRPG